MNRRERRAQGHRGPTTVLLGQGIVAAPTGAFTEARPMAQMPEKVPGKHRWIAMACYIVPDEMAAGAHDADQLKFLDNEVMYDLSIGCWDCEKQLGAGPMQACAGSLCTA